MSGNWFTDALPWRYVVIRRTYFRNLRIARVCPEIRGEINRNAFLLMVGLWVYAPIAIIFSPVLAVHFICEFILGLRIWRFLPDFEAMRIESVREANAKVEIDEVMRRLGEQPPRILSKKPN